MGRAYKCKKCGEQFQRKEHEVCPVCKTLPMIRSRRKPRYELESATQPQEQEKDILENLIDIDWEAVADELAPDEEETPHVPIETSDDAELPVAVDTTPPIEIVEEELGPDVEYTQIRSAVYDADVTVWHAEKRIEMRFSQGQEVRSYIWCPNCGRKLFESHGTFGSFTHRCGKCGYDLTLIF